MKIKLHGGASYIQPLDKMADALDAELDGMEVGETSTFDFTIVEMPPEDYEALPDFAGH